MRRARFGNRLNTLAAAALSGFFTADDPDSPPFLGFALEHVSVMGGLIAVAVASHARRELRLIDEWKPRT